MAYSIIKKKILNTLFVILPKPLWRYQKDFSLTMKFWLKTPAPQCFHTYSCIYMHAFNKKIAFWPFLLCHVVGICSVMESGWREYCVIHYQLFDRSDLPTKRTTRFFFFYILLDNTHKQKKRRRRGGHIKSKKLLSLLAYNLTGKASHGLWDPNE